MIAVDNITRHRRSKVDTCATNWCGTNWIIRCIVLFTFGERFPCWKNFWIWYSLQMVHFLYCLSARRDLWLQNKTSVAVMNPFVMTINHLCGIPGLACDASIGVGLSANSINTVNGATSRYICQFIPICLLWTTQWKWSLYSYIIIEGSLVTCESNPFEQNPSNAGSNSSKQSLLWLFLPRECVVDWEWWAHKPKISTTGRRICDAENKNRQHCHQHPLGPPK